MAALGCARRAAPAADRPHSILLVTVDTLRADRLGSYGDEAARTPAMDALASSGVLFERAYTPAPITLPAHTSMMTGLAPARARRPRQRRLRARRGTPTLAEALRARGLRTAAFIGGFPLTRRFGLARGFDAYDDAMGKAPGRELRVRGAPSADAVVASARGWLTVQPGRVFVWVHLFDPHAPYEPPPAFRGSDPYRGEIAATDAALASLITAWNARPEPSLVALTADHGEAFGEHGEESHSLFVYDTTLRVPLLVRGPGWTAGSASPPRPGSPTSRPPSSRRSGPAGPASPAAAAMARRGAPAEPLYAETLAPRLDFGWSDLRAWRDGRYKYVRAPRPELYDLEADPLKRGTSRPRVPTSWPG